MSVVAFQQKSGRSLRSWSSHELGTLVSVYEAHASRGDASAWDVGTTEFDDPQFYALGPGPDFDCVIAISRIGGIYVIENGAGLVIDEGSSLDTLAARAITRCKAASLVARITLGLTALRVTTDEKMEPFIVESEELLVRLAPQLAALI